MPTFKCVNERCENFSMPIFFTHLKFYWDNKLMKSKPRSSDVECSVCKQEMVEIPKEQEGDISFNYMSFNTKSDSEKREILKKRAKWHNNHKIKDRTESIKRKFGVGKK